MPNEEATFHPNPSRPSFILPAGAWDTHCHVFGPLSRYPYAPTRGFTPPEAPKEKLFALHAMLGIERCVIVQSSVHGFDNRAVEDALLAKAGAYRGIALLPPDAADAEIKRLSACGFCGVRFNFISHLGKTPPIAEVIRFAHRLADHGWHLQVYLDPALFEELGPALLRSPVPVVIDHMGNVDASLGLGHPGFRWLLRLMGDARFWVKLSGSERISRGDWPHRDARPFARKLVDEFGERVLWGTDWPHPNLRPPAPDDGRLADLLLEIAPSEAGRQALLVDNPQRLYGGR